jgi:hypothetical protein
MPVNSSPPSQSRTDVPSVSANGLPACFLLYTFTHIAPIQKHFLTAPELDALLAEIASRHPNFSCRDNLSRETLYENYH